MEQTKKEQNFTKQPEKKQPSVNEGSKRAPRPEIELPLRGTRTDTDLSSNPPKEKQPR